MHQTHNAIIPRDRNQAAYDQLFKAAYNRFKRDGVAEETGQ